MNYSLCRDGNTLGLRTRDELAALVQNGEISSAELALGEGSTMPRPIAEILASVPPALPPVERTFLARRGATQFGPYSLDEVVRYTRERRLQPSDIAWCPGMATWEPLPAVLQRHGHALPAGLEEKPDEVTAWMLPVGRSGLAIAAGYLGLFSVLLFPAPFALVLGILALRDLKKHPQKMGSVRAWLGVIAGAIGTVVLLLVLILPLLYK